MSFRSAGGGPHSLGGACHRCRILAEAGASGGRTPMRRGSQLLITLQSRAWRAPSVRQGAARSTWTRAAVPVHDGDKRCTASSQCCWQLTSIWPPWLPPAAHSLMGLRSSRGVATSARRKADAAGQTGSEPPGITSGDADVSTQAAEQGTDAPVKRRRKRKAEAAASVTSDSSPPSDAAVTSATAQVCHPHSCYAPSMLPVGLRQHDRW